MYDPETAYGNRSSKNMQFLLRQFFVEYKTQALRMNEFYT
jgi:hypothetical protein